METIALIAHDSQKGTILDWARRHRTTLSRFKLITTGTTGAMLEEATALNVTRFQSGPLGGDQQIGAQIVEGKVQAIIFFWDPLSTLPHDPDVRALLRLATLWNVPMACNEASADFIIESPLWQQGYQRSTRIVDQYLAQRKAYLDSLNP